MQAAAQRYGSKPTVGSFHSMSALTALLLEQATGGFAALVLLDPPICPPGKTADEMEAIGQSMSDGTLKRQNRFESRDEYAQHIARNPVFQRVRPGVPELMSETLLRPAVDGVGFELCCPREYEAQIYEYVFGWSMEIDMGRVGCPVKAISADPTARFSFMPSMDLSELVRLEYDFLPDVTHMLPVEEPDQCAALTIEFMDRYGLV